MTLAGCRVAIVADGVGPLQALDHVFVKCVGNQAHLAMGNQPLAVRRDDAARFLAAMLQSIETEVNHIGRLRMAIDAHHSAFFVEFIRHLNSREFDHFTLNVDP